MLCALTMNDYNKDMFRCQNTRTQACEMIHNVRVVGDVYSLCIADIVKYQIRCHAHTIFLHMGQGFPHQLPVLENSILHPHVKQVACDVVTISRAFC